MTKPHKIERLYAWIVTDETGEDGIPAMTVNGTAMPLVGSDKDRIESLRRFAEAIATDRNLPLRLVEFTQAVTLEQRPVTGKPGRLD